MDGIFFLVVEGINFIEREVVVRMCYNMNVYWVVLVFYGGSKKVFFFVLVMVWDEEFLVMLIGFTGMIDSLGIVCLVWDFNIEEDFDGYKVYKFYFKEEEFFGIISKFI